MTPSINYCDANLYVPHLVALDQFASWGWLTYIEDETRVFIKTVRKSVCDKVVSRILKHRHDQGESNDKFIDLADRHGWKDPELNV